MCLKKVFLSACISLCAVAPVRAQLTSITAQNFDNDTSWSYSSDVAYFSHKGSNTLNNVYPQPDGWTGDGFYGLVNIDTIANPALDFANLSGNILGENDLDDEGDFGTTGDAITTFEYVDVSNYGKVFVSFDYDIEGYDSGGDETFYEVFHNITAQGQVVLQNGSSGSADVQGSIDVKVPANVDSISLEIVVDNNGAVGYSGFDNFKIQECDGPDTTVSNVNFSNVTAQKAEFSWTPGSGDSVLVVARKDSSVNFGPSPRTSYAAPSSASVDFSAQPVVGQGSVKAIYKEASGTGQQKLTITGLSPVTEYYFEIYEFTARDYCYGTSVDTNIATPCGMPFQVKNTGSVAGNQFIALNWENLSECFDNVLIAANTSAQSVNASPVKHTSYTPSSKYNSAVADTLADGSQVIYQGSSENVTVTGLSNGTAYDLAIFSSQDRSYNSNPVMITDTPNTAGNNYTLFQEEFNNADQFIVSPGFEGSDGANNYFFRTDGSNINKEYLGKSGMNFFAGQDIDGFNGGQSPSVITWKGIDISGLESLSFSGLFASLADSTIDASDQFFVEYQVDEKGFNDTLLAFKNDGNTYNTYFLEDTNNDGVGDGTALDTTFQKFTKNILTTGSSLDLRVIVDVASGDEDIAFDNLQITGNASTTAPKTYTFNGSWGANGNPSTIGDGTASIRVENGVASISDSTSVNSLVVEPEAGLTIDPGATLRVNSGVLKASADSTYGQLIGEVSGEVQWQSVLSSDSARWYNNAIPVKGTLADIGGVFLNMTGSTNTQNIYRYDAITDADNNNEGDWVMATESDSLGTTAYQVYLSPAFGGSATKLSAFGEVLSGEQTIAITNNSANNEGWNYIPNPFLSTLDWSKVNSDADNNEINGSTYYIQAGPPGTQVYRSYNGSMGAGMNGGNANLPPGQAFFVQTNSSGQLSFKRSHRNVTGSTDLYKKGTTNIPLVKLRIANDSTGYSDETALGFARDLSISIDQRTDARKRLNANYPNAYTKINGANFAYNGVSNNFKTHSEPIFFTHQDSGKHTLTLSQNTLPSSWTVELEDQVTNGFTDLEKGQYSFQHSSGNRKDRFILHINKNGVGLREVVTPSIYAYVQEDVLHVNLEQQKGKVKLKVYDLSGRLLAAASENGSNVAQIDLSRFSRGVYLLKVQQKGRNIHTQKILK